MGFSLPVSYIQDFRTVGIVEDTPQEVQISVVGPGNDPEDPLVTIGLPYGYRSADVFVQKLKTATYGGWPPLRDYCPGVTMSKRATMAGLSGTTFDCWIEQNIDYFPIYPKDARGANRGPGLGWINDWFTIPKGGPYTRFFVTDFQGKVVVISIQGAGGGAGPGEQPLVREMVARFEALDIRFGQ